MHERFNELFARHQAGGLSHAEQIEFWGLILQPGGREHLRELAAGIDWDHLSMVDSAMPEVSSWKILAEIRSRGKDNRGGNGTEAPVVTMHTQGMPQKIGWKKWAIAAAVMILLGAGVYQWWALPGRKQSELSETNTDIAPPQSQRATITLEDGRVIQWEEAGAGELLRQNDVRLLKQADGGMVYKADGASVSEIEVYNTLTNPRGSQAIQITLSDGSAVWLNAGSSLRYPVRFIGNQRKVSITGEGYFEIAKDPSRPFMVTKDQLEVEVLGTHFNVNAYADEPSIKVSLLEGAVKTGLEGDKRVLLKPGEQAEIVLPEAGSGTVKVNRQVDLEQVIAWKNGRFVFGQKMDIATISRQLERWYDVSIEHRGEIRAHFGGSISRQVNVSQVLEVLQSTGGIHYKMEGRKIILMP